MRALATPFVDAVFIRRQSNLQAVWALTGLSVMLLFSFPIFAFAFAALLLINLPDYTPRRARLVLAVVVMVSMSLMMSSRPVSTEGSDDLIGYYDLYVEISKGNYERFAQFGGGLEIALTSLFFLWSRLLPDLTMNGLMLCMTLTSSMLFIWWVERTFYGNNTKTGVVLMGAAVLLFNVYFSTQLVRQFLALVLLLNAFSAPTRVRQLLYVALAATFHVTAIAFYLLYLIGRRGLPGILFLVGLFFLLRIFFARIVGAFNILPEVLAEKVLYYVDSTASYTTSDLASFRMIGILCAVSIIVFIVSGGRIRRDQRPWHLVPWAAAVVHILLLPIPLASLRTTLLVHSIVPGVVMYQMISRRRRLLLLIIVNLLLINKLAAYAGLEGNAGLTSTFGALVGAIA